MHVTDYEFEISCLSSTPFLKRRKGSKAKIAVKYMVMICTASRWVWTRSTERTPRYGPRPGKLIPRDLARLTAMVRDILSNSHGVICYRHPSQCTFLHKTPGREHQRPEPDVSIGISRERKELETWGEKLEATTFQRMKTLLSIAFLKARARSFEAGRSGGGRIGLEELTGIF